MTLGAGQVFAGYTIIRQLGAGGMGEVYLAQHPRLPRQEALKLLRPEITADPTFRARFIREADSIAALDHPHIVTVYDRGDADGTLWIATQYIDGTDTARLMRDRYPAGMPATEALAITTAIAEALDYAHDRGLVHRDVKPANILLSQTDTDGNRRAFLADFGIARTLGDSDGLTATNFTLGTFAYAAPEQLMGQPLDGRADQYALAATTYHLLTGTPIFPDSNPVVAMNHHLNTPPPSLTTVRPDLADLDPILAKALSKDPASRYPLCVDFARALTECAAPACGESTSTGPTMAASVASPAQPNRPQPPSPDSSGTAPLAEERQVTRALWVAAAAALVAIAALVMVWSQRQSSTDSAPTSTPNTSLAASPAPPLSPSTQTVTKTLIPPPLPPSSIEVKPPAPAGNSLIFGVGTIAGSCDEGGSCGVKQRNAPRNAAAAITPQPLLDGTRIAIVCQTIGDLRENLGYGASDIWYQTQTGAFIPSVYVRTGTDRFPRC